MLETQYLFEDAAEKGDLSTVEKLIQAVDPKANNSRALRLSAKQGHIHIFEFLLKFSDPNAEENYALRWASMGGHTQIVKTLVKLTQTTNTASMQSNFQEAILWASEKGYIDCLNLLLPKVQEVNDFTLTSIVNRVAENSDETFISCLKTIIPYTNYNQILKNITNVKEQQILEQYIFEHEALLQKKHLTSTIEKQNNNTNQKDATKRKI